MFGVILGGIFGNFYDCLGFWYGCELKIWNGVELFDYNFYVVCDWIYFCWEGVFLSIFDFWLNFNIVDSLFVCGVIFLFIYVLFVFVLEK